MHLPAGQHCGRCKGQAAGRCGTAWVLKAGACLSDRGAQLCRHSCAAHAGLHALSLVCLVACCMLHALLMAGMLCWDLSLACCCMWICEVWPSAQQVYTHKSLHAMGTRVLLLHSACAKSAPLWAGHMLCTEMWLSLMFD